jgi:predicted permease
MGASLFVRTLQNLETLDVGFSREHTVLITFDPGNSGYRGAKLAELSDEFERRIRTLPGVVATATATGTPFGAPLGGSPVQVPGYIPNPDDPHFCAWNMVGAGFFRASGIPLLRGREFGPQDGEVEPDVTASEVKVSAQPAVVNETFARKYFAGLDAVGRRFTIRRGTPIEVIGVAKDAKYKNLRERTEPLIYLFNARDRSSWRRLNLIVRFTGAPRYAGSLMTAIRAEVSRANGSVRIAVMETMQNLIDQSLLKEHMVMDLSSAAGGLALLIVCIGVYGAVSYAVARRKQEIGIRAALGASQTEILWMVLRESLTTVLAGVVFGLPAALVVARFLAERLFGVTAADPLSIAATIVLIAAVAATAGVVPAWGGCSIDPMAALRYE